MARKTSLGRQKIAIAKISNKNSLHVTFSKRRTGLFKKASELSTLCGAEIALLVFSPSNKVFSFGNPDVNSVIDRFLLRSSSDDKKSSSSITTNNNNNNNNNMMSLKMLEAYSREDSVRVHNMMLVDLLNQLEQENDRRKELEHRRKAQKAHSWWEAPIDELNLVELEKLRVSLEQLKENVKMESLKLMAMPPPDFVSSTYHDLMMPLPLAGTNDHINAANLSWNVGDHQFEQKREICVDDGHLGLAQFLNFDPENVFF